ncbi:UTRA domain-containing protein [Temperatibacter marinus]|uniref:UTRA domain-containing protein n=1 Tax=Temperatibacter marinus TaxID=1456591 RepID=A0AA52EFW4_9PROT|nr:UTRA domain-containing protein [Temperatibacter marinus]WND01782.1 UTRA domain-containing protein [Temperatibacter marinus]
MTQPVARYLRVKNHIIDLIAKGDLTVGDQVPSENQLVKDMGISRMTVNRAFKELEAESQIVRRAGLGSFVAEKRVHGEALKVVGIRNEIESRGEIWSTKIIECGFAKLAVAMAGEMELNAGSRVFRLRAVHFGNGIPIELEDRLINPKVVPEVDGADFTKTSSAEFLLDIAPLLKAEHQIRALEAGKEEAIYLDVDRGDACLQIKRRTWTGKQVASVARLTYPGSRYELTARFDNA